MNQLIFYRPQRTHHFQLVGERSEHIENTNYEKVVVKVEVRKRPVEVEVEVEKKAGGKKAG